MNRVILQVPMSKELREKAMSVAMEKGFSSLQEVVRLLVTKLAKRQLSMTFISDENETLSPRAIKRYRKAIADIKRGKNVTSTQSLDELFSLLRS